MSDPPSSVTLVPFTEGLLSVVQPWFRHPEARRRLGRLEWPVRELRLMATMPARSTGGGWSSERTPGVALDSTGEPLAKIGGDVYDRWNRYDGSRPDRPVVTLVEPGPAMPLAYVVEPARWRQGIGCAVLRAAVQHRDVGDVRVFAGIDPDNEASRRCAASAGFLRDVDHPDWEDAIYYLLRRTAALCGPAGHSEGAGR